MKKTIESTDILIVKLPGTLKSVYAYLSKFSFHPNAVRKWDMKDECKRKESPMWRVFRGCGHSYHTVCLIPDISSFPKCAHVVSIEIKTLATKATEAVFQLDQVNELEDDSAELEEEDIREDEQNILGAESGCVEALFQPIWSWQRPNVPMT